MNTALSSRRLFRTFSLVTVASFAGLIAANPASAMDLFLNSGFEDDFNGWETLGDTSTQSTFQGLNPRNTSQGLLTTSCPATPFPSGECFDTQNPSNFRQDDPAGGNNNRTFNFSGRDQGDANGNNFNQDGNLQNFLNLPSNSLNIPRKGGTISGTRTPKEGSAIKQTITVEDGSIITFDWNHLTNDGTDPILGNQDYSFVTIYNTQDVRDDRTIQILGDSTGDITTPIDGSQTEFEKANDGYRFFSSEPLDAGTYVVGAGVVDVDGTGISSGLLLDNFEVVPFDFSATTGLGLVAGVFGLSRLRRRFKSE